MKAPTPKFLFVQPQASRSKRINPRSRPLKSMSKSRNLEPIISHVVLQLSDLGIQSTSTSFQISKLQSSHFLCAHEKEVETNNVTMVDLANSNKVVRYTTIADSAIIHPYSYIIAMRAGRQLKIFNVEKQTDVGLYIFPEDIHFAKWISDTTIGVITEKVIFHWDTRDTTPRRICDRHSWFSGAQIIDYQTTLGEKWMALVGIVKDAESGES
ncbi:hypothetical protein FRC02_009080 [Tulasnella sp. 418]|nr:hypothetical protein FRC02_009080 [Tulasnella sp. 418]